MKQSPSRGTFHTDSRSRRSWGVWTPVGHLCMPVLGKNTASAQVSSHSAVALCCGENSAAFHIQEALLPPLHSLLMEVEAGMPSIYRSLRPGGFSECWQILLPAWKGAKYPNGFSHVHVFLHSYKEKNNTLIENKRKYCGFLLMQTHYNLKLIWKNIKTFEPFKHGWLTSNGLFVLWNFFFYFVLSQIIDHGS